jgi:hypothetical protein
MTSRRRSTRFRSTTGLPDGRRVTLRLCLAACLRVPYRIFRDPTRIVDAKNRLEKEQMLSLPWIPTLDAGVRQCERLDEGLKDEVEVISGLLSASATIASARDAQAQGQFNAVAGAVAVGFGLPALILALYGIDDNPAPFRDTVHGFVLFLPLAAALGLGMWVWRRIGRSTPSVFRRVIATLAAGVCDSRGGRCARDMALSPLWELRQARGCGKAARLLSLRTKGARSASPPSLPLSRLEGAASLPFLRVASVQHPVLTGDVRPEFASEGAV